jgi:hypothetical protein
MERTAFNKCNRSFNGKTELSISLKQNAIEIKYTKLLHERKSTRFISYLCEGLVGGMNYSMTRRYHTIISSGVLFDALKIEALRIELQMNNEQ